MMSGGRQKKNHLPKAKNDKVVDISIAEFALALRFLHAVCMCVYAVWIVWLP
jgi:hypothetical protein